MAKSTKNNLPIVKVDHLKEKVRVKDLQLNALLEITNLINGHFSTGSLLDKYQFFVKEKLRVEKLALFSFRRKWNCILSYGFNEKDLFNIIVERDLVHMKEITSVNAEQKNVFEHFDIVIPVYNGQIPLAYLLLADNDNQVIKISNLIKHLNFLQLFTNITVTAIEKKRMSDEILKQEKEKRQLIEKQNEILEKLILERTNELRQEKDQSNRLLYNILPEDLAEELKHHGSITPMRYDHATVLFTDFKDFTRNSAHISPKKLVTELNEIFQAFDFITEKYNIEKIKTIGDSYMAVCGLPKESEFHAIQTVRAAMDMVKYIKDRQAKKRFKWEMRVGIHSGPLVAGVVGTKKFIYDVWGDTVNIASRMETYGKTNEINISEKTHEQIKKIIDCEYRGKKTVKGKGKLKMYIVKAEKESNRYLKVKKFIINKLKKNLPKNLFYHGLHHTIDVCDVAAEIALKEMIDFENIELIKVAALFHDSGFIKVYDENEIIGCRIAREILPKFEYSREEIKTICRMIIATHTPQQPKNRMEEILADADLDYLGRADFDLIAKTLFNELNENGKAISVKDWNLLQIDFMKKHTYFTKTSQEIRNKGKQKQLEKLMAES